MDEKIEQWLSNHVPQIRAWAVALEEKFSAVHASPNNISDIEVSDVWELLIHVKTVVDIVRQYRD